MTHDLPTMTTDRADGDRDLKQRSDIEQFAIDYDMPQELANRFIGTSEAETERLVNMLYVWIKTVVLPRYKAIILKQIYKRLGRLIKWGHLA